MGSSNSTQVAISYNVIFVFEKTKLHQVTMFSALRSSVSTDTIF